MSIKESASWLKPAPIKKPRNVIVVGMPRSGTSLTASVFAARKYYVTSEEQADLRPGDEGNPFGYWEAGALIEHNVAVLNRAGFPFHNTWMYEPIKAEHVAKVYELEVLAEHRAYLEIFDQHSPWVWKDPRLCYTLAYWWPMMNPLTTSVLLLRRNPEAIYQSFRRRNWCSSSAQDKRDIFLRIDNHLNAAEQAIKKYNIPYVEIDYQDYISTPDATAKKIAEFFGIELGASDLNVKSELNHNSALGHLSANIAKLVNHLPLRYIKMIARLVPLKVIYALYPEKKLTRKD